MRIDELGGAVAWGADGTFAATRVDDPGVAEIRDGVTGDLLRTVAPGVDKIVDLGFDPTGSVLAVAGRDHLWLYDAATGRRSADVAGEGRASGVSFSAGAPLVAAAWAGERVVRIVDVRTGDVVSTVDVETFETALDARGERVAVVADGRTQVRDVATGSPVLPTMTPNSISGVPYGVSDLAWSPDDRSIVAIGLGGLDVWDATTGTLRVSEPLGWGTAAAWNADGSLLITGGPAIRAWRVDALGNLTLAAVLPLPSAAGVDEARSVDIAPDGSRTIASGWEGTIGVWDPSPQGDAEWMHVLAAPFFGSVWFLPDGALVGAGADERLTTWDPQTGSALASFGPPVHEYHFPISTDGLVAIPTGGSWTLWDPVRGAEAGDVPEGPEAWNPDGTGFVAGDTVFDASGHVLAMLDEEDLEVNARLWTDDGRWIIGAIAGSTPGIGLWNPETGERVRTIEIGPSNEDLFMAARGDRVAIRGARGLPEIWDLGTGSRVAELDLPQGGCGLAFSPDGRLLAVGARDTTIRVFDATDGRQLLALRGHELQSCSVAFNDDGSMLASQSPGEIRVWALDLDDLLEIARANVTRSLTGDECRRFLHLAVCAAG